MAVQVCVVRGPAGAVAVKRAVNAAGRSRLAREAAVLRRVAHPLIVELREHRNDDAGAELVLTWVPGGSLAAGTPARRRPLPELVTVLAGAATALAHLHAQGLTHGRVTGDHVLVAEDGTARLTGLAEARDGGPAEAAEDVRALGLLLTEVLDTAGARRGNRPWRRRPAPAPHAGLSSRLRTVAARAVDPERERRCTAAALADLLRDAAGPAPARIVEPRRPADRPGARRRVAVVVAALALTGAGLLAVTHASALRSAGAAPPRSLTVPAATPSSGGPSAASAGTSPTAPTTVPVTDPPTAAAPPTLIWAPACPPAGPPAADVDGDGCPGTVVVQGGSLEVEGRRYTVGADDGDLTLIGDWDCDGVGTPAVVRLPSGALDVFDHWPDDARTTLTARRAGVVAGAVGGVAGPGCGVVTITTAGGAAVPVAVAP